MNDAKDILESWNWAPVDPGFHDYETGTWEDPPCPAVVYVGDDDTRPEEHNTVAWMNSADPEAVQESRAQLISAAPDLLSACLAFAAWDEDPHSTEADAAALRCAVAAAIAKATGSEAANG